MKPVKYSRKFREKLKKKDESRAILENRQKAIQKRVAEINAMSPEERKAYEENMRQKLNVAKSISAALVSALAKK